MNQRTRFGATSLASLIVATTYALSSQSQVVPAPDWAVWRVFHDSLEFYSRESPSQVDEVFAARAGLTKSEVEVVMAAGRAYLQELAAVEQVARAQIEQRLESSRTSALSMPTAVRPSERSPVSEALRSSTSQMGPDLSALAQEGFFTRVEQQQKQVLAAHRQRITKAIGVDRLRKIDEWIQMEVAPSVKTVRREQRPAASAR